MLTLYNSDARCPRYTAILNVLFTLLFPVLLTTVISRLNIRAILAVCFTLLFIIQTYLTIDPAITLYCNYIDIGKSKVYRLSSHSDDGTIMWGNNILMGDYYVYNYQHMETMHLVRDLFAETELTENDCVYLIGTHPYEYNLRGAWRENYKVFWNTRLKTFTFDAQDKDNIYLKIHPYTNAKWKTKKHLPKQLYVFVAPQFEEETIQSVIEKGYVFKKSTTAENLYGYLKLLEFQKEKK